MNCNQKWRATEILFLISAWLFVMMLHGAIPFVMAPCSGQAIWTAGFAKSFTYGHFFTIYAHDFGMPRPAAISFGLAGAWPMSVLIRLGLHPIDAYTMITMCWLSVAFFSAFLIARNFGNSRYSSLLGTLVWMVLPMIWFHAHYGMLFLGMSLLAFYFITALYLFDITFKVTKDSFLRIFLFLLATLVSVFMDGYTFMMFFVGSAILLFFKVITLSEHRASILKIVLPIYLSCFVISYVLYCVFIGKLNYNSQPIEVFRSYGVDLFYLAIPSQGMLWLADLLDYNIKRPSGIYFGDPSVWRSTFLLPIMLVGVIAWWLCRKKPIAISFFVVALFAFYMSLGPSLKINSKIPPEMHPTYGKFNVAMSSKLAVMSTGSAALSKHLPGFNDMRSAYRWSVLEAFAFWCLIMVGAASSKKNKKIIWQGILLILIFFELPHLVEKTRYHLYSRSMFFQIDQKLIVELQRSIRHNEMVAFVPWGNDFLVNYLAPMSGFHTYNIGGDKNLVAAQEQWPTPMRTTGTESLDSEKVQAGIKMLVDGGVDVLIFPYFSTLWREAWPCPQYDSEACILQNKKNLQPTIQQLQTLPYLAVTNMRLFTIVRLKEK